MKIFLSAGHTPRRPGAVAEHVELDEGGATLVEHDLNREFVFYIANALRSVEPSIVPVGRLRDRINYVNRWASAGDFALEVHHNASESKEAHGVEAFYLVGSRGGVELAGVTTSAIANSFGTFHRGARPMSQSRHGRLAWLKRTKPWAALLEVEFITNPESALWLVGPGHRGAAQAVARVIDKIA